MSRRLRFDAPPHHRLELPDFEEPIAGQTTFEVANDRAEELLADESLELRVADLDKLKRADLEDLARAAGVVAPEDLPTKADVIAAIEEPEAAAGEEPESEGEGPDDTQNPEEAP